MAVALLLTGVGCATTTRQAGKGGPFAVTSPADGFQSTRADILVVGTAPSSAKITCAIPSAVDDHATANEFGDWEMHVHLNDGSNELAFRLDSDKSSSITIHVSLGQLDTSTPSATAAPTATAAVTPKAAATEAVSFAITSHRDGDSVATSLIAVEGTAPAKSPITRDIPMTRDTHAVADDSGHWMIPVSLKEGDNSLTFRIGDDKSTAKTIHIAYHKPAATPAPARTPSATSKATAAAVSTSKSTAAPTLKPTPKPTVPPATLGSRNDIQVMLSALSGYTWQSSPLNDGTPRSLGRSDDQLAVCEITGPASGVTSVDVLFVAGDYSGTYHAGAMLGILLDDSQSLPAITWAESQIASALSKGDEIDKTQTFGNRRVRVMTGLVETSMIAVIVVTPA